MVTLTLVTHPFSSYVNILLETATGHYEIHPRQELKIGRADVKDMLDEYDETISNEHISIRCIQFDEDTSWNVHPVIYVENLSRNGAAIERAFSDEEDSQSSSLVDFQKIGESVPFLHNDRIYLNRDKGIFVQLAQKAQVSKPPMNSVMMQELKLFSNEFTLTPQVIGVGGHGTVYTTRRRRESSYLACKVVPLYGADISQRHASSSECALIQDTHNMPRAQASTSHMRSKLHRLEVEYAILKDLSHPNIVTVRRVFITTHHLYIMQELITGGDLLSLMEKEGMHLSAPRAAVIILQVLKALEYLHDRDVVHRDIKPDNILLSSWEDAARVVLTDFGHAKKIGRSTSRRMFTVVGTVGYTAPEVHNENSKVAKDSGYSTAVDMWSVGTISAVLLTGDMIFPGSQYGSKDNCGSTKSKLHAAARCDLSVIDDCESEWASVSKRARDFVKALLVLDEKERLTAKQALQHPYMSCPRYADIMERIYKRAVRDWKPCAKMDGIVTKIDTSEITSSSPVSSETESPDPVTSAHFNPAQLSPSVAGAQQSLSMSSCDGYQQGRRRDDLEGGYSLPEDMTNGSSFQDMSGVELGGSIELGAWPITQVSPDHSMAEATSRAPEFR